MPFDEKKYAKPTICKWSLVVALFLLRVTIASARIHLPLSGTWLSDPPKDGDVLCERELLVPAGSSALRPFFVFRMLNGRAEVAVDGRNAGACEFPGGAVDLTGFLPDGKHVRLQVRLIDTSGSSKYGIRGVSGDTYLEFVPRDGWLQDVFVQNVSTNEAKIVAEISEELKSTALRMSVDIKGGGTSRHFMSELSVPDKKGRLTCRIKFPGSKQWDINSPDNLYLAHVSVFGKDGRMIDGYPPVSFGFRHFSVIGRGLELNGIPLRLRGFYTRLVNGSAKSAEPSVIREALRRMKRLGSNFLITGNFGFANGDQRSPDDLLRICDEEGMLTAFSLPHCKDFSSDSAYRACVEKAVRLARSHPSVIMYTTSHNWCGYDGDLNPLKIDGRFDPLQDGVPQHRLRQHRTQAERAETIIRSIDPTRPVHHHAGGNLGQFHSVNAYFNWMPVQERSDWPERWARDGAKPLVAIEWGLPYEPSWSSYRGPDFIWRTPSLQSCWAAEYAAAFFGDRAYLDTLEARRALEVEDLLRCEGPFLWTRLAPSLKKIRANYNGVQGEYLSDNWRSLRAWGVPVIIPQNQSEFFVRRLAGASFLSGFGSEDDYEPTESGVAFRRWNAPVIGFIGGESVFTDKRHVYCPGETMRKNLVLVNDLRTVTEVFWHFGREDGCDLASGRVRVPPGDSVSVPLSIPLPKAPGEVRFRAWFDCADSSVAEDHFVATVLLKSREKSSAHLSVWDPEGVTFDNLNRLGLDPVRSNVPEPVEGSDVLVLGRNALTTNVLESLWGKIDRGLRVVVFEQDAKHLEAIGFRVTEYGLRRVFARDDGFLKELPLRDWAGESTLVSPYLENLPPFEHEVPSDPYGPPGATRVWRCRMRGAVASVLPEKPEVGGWRALVDGGFDLRYAPILERRYGRGAIVFCQMDVNARTEYDPAADELVRRLVARPLGGRPDAAAAIVRGSEAQRLCGLHGVETSGSFDGGILILSSGGALPWPYETFRSRVEKGMNAILLDLGVEEVRGLLPELSCQDHDARGYSVRFPGKELPSCLLGCSNADWMWHGGMAFRALSGPGAGMPSLRVLQMGKGTVVVWQTPPWRFDIGRRPQLRLSLGHAHYLFSRLLDNLGVATSCHATLYATRRRLEDQPYCYYRW